MPGFGVADDLSKGMIDRLRSLPMYPSAVLIGRTLSDIVRNVLTFAVMLIVAFVIGFRFEGSFLGALAATGLMFLFSYAFSWIQALIGLSVGSVEAANSAGFIWMFPLTFVSSAFVDVNRMTSWLRPIARNNPFTVLTNACRALYNGYDAGNDLGLIGVCSGITVVCAILTAQFRSRRSLIPSFRIRPRVTMPTRLLPTPRSARPIRHRLGHIRHWSAARSQWPSTRPACCRVT